MSHHNVVCSDLLINVARPKHLSWNFDALYHFADLAVSRHSLCDHTQILIYIVGVHRRKTVQEYPKSGSYALSTEGAMTTVSVAELVRSFEGRLRNLEVVMAEAGVAELARTAGD